MTPEILQKLFPVALPDVAAIEAQYPPRQLQPGQKVTRVAPSPTGYLHIGALYAGLVSERVAHQSDGLFYLRVEDTDQKRLVPEAVDIITKAYNRFGIFIDEGVLPDGSDKGAYGPYTQSKRRLIYLAYAKKLVEEGLAYPCFCSEEELTVMRKVQEKQSLRPGYYGRFAKCRHLTDAQILENLNAGKPYVLRFKSPGNSEKRLQVKDLMKGELSLPENDLDIVLIKGDGLPMYHFAHAVDDHLMGTTHVIRGDEWLSSVPLHIQLFVALGWKAPKYGHYAPLQKLDNGNKRKISKRYDPEANVMFFVEKGYPEAAVIEYLMNLINAAFEDWRRTNPDKKAFEFQMNFNKISNTGGALFDFQKLNSISKDVIARMSAAEVYDAVLAWASAYRPDFAARMNANREYMIRIFDIERNIGKKSRKDFIKWEDIPADVSYFFDDLLDLSHNKELLESVNLVDIQQIAANFAALYDESDDKDTWFSKIKTVAEKHGFAGDMKSWRDNPTAFKGSVADVAKVLRVLVTGRDQTPDLHAIMRLLGAKVVQNRLMKV